jgi:hypothetical protein
MMNRTAVRSLLESRCGGNRQEFIRRVSHYMGLTDANGRKYLDRAGNPELRNPREGSGSEFPRMRADEFSLRSLWEGLVGEDTIESHCRPNMIERALIEDNGAGAVPASAFADINAWTAVTSGLLEISILEQWRAPEFIGDILCPPKMTKMAEGRKIIGSTRIGNQAEPRQPLMPTKRVQIGERWVTQPRTVEGAAAIEVSQEAVFFDLTGEVTEEAGNVGFWVGYEKELLQIDGFIGVTNTYTYKGNNYNTYITGGYYNNLITGNDLQYHENILTDELAFRDMIDPETNTRVLIQPNTILCQRERKYIADLLVGGGEYQHRTAPGATATDQSIRRGDNPWKGRYRVIESPLVYQRITDATGLNVSTTNAGKYWWLFESGKVAEWSQNWPLRVQTAAPNQVDMIDRGVVLFVKADQRGVVTILEPRRSVMNTN